MSKTDLRESQRGCRAGVEPSGTFSRLADNCSSIYVQSPLILLFVCAHSDPPLSSSLCSAGSSLRIIILLK